MLKEGSFILGGRSLQIVGPETLTDLGLNVIVLVLGMYSCPEVADLNNCLQPGIEKGASPFKRRYQYTRALGDLESYSLLHWQPMKVVRHWRNVIVFLTSNKPC